MNEAEMIQKLANAGKTTLRSVICTVKSVDRTNYQCDLAPVDGSADIIGARLTSTKGINSTWVLYPTIGSYVIATQLTRNDAFIILCDEVDDAELLNHGHVKVQPAGDIELIAGLQAVLKNSQTSLKTILNDLLAELQTATMGPYNYTPSVVAKLAELNVSVNQLFKE